ncbi:SARP family transcriptional regulator [Deinococcus sp. KSM4-11]|uniref:SARP family transcriptional regulator n=1 Tax=Deinococcus sp. KSM4-11 TaxID=2568654 RepID=UPI0010A354E4|nr:SARP family transcriptional regulator [Deinococcus sp. KSM4-11]THF85534.1 SARP family transcriptional regulator [Deinococcus sp. KSM4-11]
MSQAQRLFEARQYEAVVTLLLGHAKGAREGALLGIALIRVGRLADAEVALTRAAMQGDAEAQVELGNVLRLLGRFEDAIDYFETVTPTLSGELQLRALRWWGVAEFRLGRVQDGLKRVERAWHGYLALGDGEPGARVALCLAEMHRVTGNEKRAQALLTETVHALPADEYPGPHVEALKLLLELHLGRGEYREARVILDRAKLVLPQAHSPRLTALLLGSEAELCRLTRDTQTYGWVLEELRPLADQLGDHDLRLWTLSRLAELYSLHGQHGKALEALLSFGSMPADWPAELVATHGILQRRRGDLRGAQESLTRAAGLLRAAGRIPELCRVQLHAAAAALRCGDDPGQAVVPALTEAVTHLLRLRQLGEFTPDFEELSELLHYALLEPDTATLMEPFLEHLADLSGVPRPPESGMTLLNVKTLGRQAVFKDGIEVTFTRKGCVPLLVYLALNPGRTRVEIQLDLWPDKDAATAGSYVRQCIKEVRDRLGHGLIQHQGPHHAPWYRLGPEVHVELDLTHLLDAVDRRETARALALYRGDFLPGADASEWVDTKRDALRYALTFELSAQMVRAQSQHDHRRVVLLANQYLRVDPYDRSVMEDRVTAARHVASPQELAQYTAELRRHMYN